MLKQITFIILFFSINVLFAQNFSASKKNQDSIKLAASLAETDALRAKLKAEISKTKEGATAPSADSLNTMSSKPENDAALNQLKAKHASDQIEINRLKTDLEKIKINTSNTPNSINLEPKERSSTNDYFLDNKGKPVSPGFYVVIGTFSKKENADRFRASNYMKGHLNTKIIRNQITKVYNIIGLKTNNKADADSERIKYKAEYPDVWILKIE